ncbi:uncharacterized protein LOC110035896 [Phalaenopsis equestris]|uniref:uncharacterized protein LOC110035896 n=1 Tax=Phalaenopsis equestris TaxID=78828 RepID=UPI0009E1B934|nr:uncharacterized protein LOC110035896 [Phalaenopsis equestris]
MPRSSRHKSHRSHKHSSRDARERSESEDDGNSRDRRQRVEELCSGSAARVSKDSEADKRKSSSSLLASQERNKGLSENGDCSAEHGRKRKERGDDFATPDRWNGSGKDDGLAEKVSKEEAFGSFDNEKVEKSKILTVESKSRSSRRRESSAERYVVSSSRSESLKRRSEKEYSRREIREDKERDIERGSEGEKDRERASERDKRVQDARLGKSDDVEMRNQGSRRGGAEEERLTKQDNTEFQTREDMHNAELEKDSEKYTTKRRRSSGGFDKWHDDGKNIDERRLSSRDDHLKNGGHKVEGNKDERYKDDRYKDDRYRDKHFKDLDRDHRHRDIRHREERSSRDYASDRIEGKSVRDRDKPVESYSKKSKLHGSDREFSPRAEDHLIKTKDTGAQKSFYDENDDHYGSKHRNVKETRLDLEKDASNSSKIEYKHQGKVDSSLLNNLSKGSLSPKAHSSNDHNRRGLKVELINRDPVADDRVRRSEDYERVSVVHERVSESLSSEKMKHRDRIKSDDKERRLSLENLNTDNHLQADFHNSERVSVPPSPFKRTVNFPGGSPGHLRSQTPMRQGRESPSIYEDDNRIKSGDRRSTSRHKRNNDPNIERGQGVTWKNSSAWPAPVPNGFIPFQHGQPAPGFHSGIQHFPPSLFGARPYMEMNQTGIPYHMHEVADRFTAHGHPFGWHHPADDSCPPQMQGWDGSNSFYGDKSQVYVRPDWDQNRHLVGGRGWALNAEMWRGQPGNMSVELSVNQEGADESRGAHCSLQPKTEVDRLQHLSGDASQLKQYTAPPNDKSVEASIETKLAKTSLPYQGLNNNSQSLSVYLSRLEISADLVYPELYKDIRNILTAGNSTVICTSSMDENTKKNKVEILSKVSKLSSHIPTAADAAFKRAMSVYEKQHNGRKAKVSSLVFCSKEMNASPEATNVNENNAPDSSVPKEPSFANTISLNLMEKPGANESTARPMEEENLKNSPCDPKTSATEMEVDHIKTSSDGYIKHESDLISDVVDSPQACEDIMPDCKVNLSRIHNPPESTH